MSFSKKFDTYFAAANGYDGFRSYFGEVFRPENYERLYILKGGPGTGKSTLMRGVGSHFEALGFDTERVLCSSDPNSLDGVIIYCGNKKFAVIDGTAPHETDAKIPGAFDEIINLGEAWHKEKLVSKREEILNINRRKSTHYKKAYELLKLAGNFSSQLASLKSEILPTDFEEFANSILSNLQNKIRGRNTKTKLISSFGKSGYNTLKKEFSPETRKISVVGMCGTETLFMSYLSNAATRKHVNFTLFPSPLSPEIIEGIYFEDNDTFVSTLMKAQTQIDTSRYADSLNFDSTTDFSDSIHDELLEHAKEEFALASSAHFELENIYTPAMDFDRISKIREQIISDIEQTV